MVNFNNDRENQDGLSNRDILERIERNVVKTKSVGYDISETSYDLVGRISTIIGMKKSSFVDSLIERYAIQYLHDIKGEREVSDVRL